MGHRDYRERRVWQPASLALAVGLAALVALVGVESSTTAASTTVLIAAQRRRSIAGLVGSIAGGSLVLGGLAWVVTTQIELVPEIVGTGLGLAIGGGLGSVVWLLAVDTAGEDSSETVTVDMEDGPDRPTPEPADLFDASPDPIVFFAEDGDQPVVIAVNDAFERLFGVSGDALTETPLGDGLFVDTDTDDIVAAVREGRSFDRVLRCETDEGHERMRVRLALTGKPHKSGGYVIYTPVEDE